MPVPTYRVKNQNDAPPRSALGNGYGRRMYGRSAAKRLILSRKAGFLLFHTALNFVFKKVARAHCAHKQIYTDAPITVRSKRSALLHVYRSSLIFVSRDLASNSAVRAASRTLDAARAA